MDTALHHISRVGLACALTALATFAQPAEASAPIAATQGPPVPVIVSDGHDRIADPKLAGGGVRASFHYGGTAGTTLGARVDVYGPQGFIKTVWTGTLTGGAAPTTVGWNGRDASGLYVDTGSYRLVVVDASGSPSYYSFPVEVVRFGITEIEFQESPSGSDEWQMVYFLRNGVAGWFTATPAIHEYANLAKAGDISAVDLNNGEPRPAVAPHLPTDYPITNGFQLELERQNYPLAYERGATPRLQVALGASGTTSAGQPMSSNYPVPGYDIRLRATFPGGTVASSTPITPGAQVWLDGDMLPSDLSLTEWTVEWRWQYSANGGATWKEILGSHSTIHRIYTIWGDPVWAAGASGTQYVGPWVEVVDYVVSWKSTLGISTATSGGLVEAFVKGFFGQNGGISTAIEGVKYDTLAIGGDSGAPHYMDDPAVGTDMDLSALLHAHANGIFVNCSDNSGAATTMLSMLGLPNLRPVYLEAQFGQIELNAIWGIGTSTYTTNLWGGAIPHEFNFHRIATRTDGADVIDTCMQLDEDGTPGSTPGIPGWNVDRPWDSYEALACTDNLIQTLEALPGLK